MLTLVTFLTQRLGCMTDCVLNLDRPRIVLGSCILASGKNDSMVMFIIHMERLMQHHIL